MRAVSAMGSRSTDVITVRVRDALDRLLRCAMGDSRQSARCADFLLALVYPAQVGPPRIATIGCGLSLARVEDMALVFGAALGLQARFQPIESLGFRDRFQALLHRWHPEALGLPPAPPRAVEIQAFRARHDLSLRDLAALLSIEAWEIAAWEAGDTPMPLSLWQAARVLMGEADRHADAAVGADDRD